MAERQGFILKLVHRRTGHVSYGCAPIKPWIRGKDTHQIREVETPEDAAQYPLFDEGYAVEWARVLCQTYPDRYCTILYLPLKPDQNGNETSRPYRKFERKQFIGGDSLVVRQVKEADAKNNRPDADKKK